MTTNLLDHDTQLDATIADLFNLDARETQVQTLGSGYGRSANCTNDGCTGTCVSCGCRHTD